MEQGLRSLSAPEAQTLPGGRDDQLPGVLGLVRCQPSPVLHLLVAGPWVAPPRGQPWCRCRSLALEEVK